MTKECIKICRKMFSKIHFDGGPIEFFGCIESAKKFFHWFSNIDQFLGAFLPNWLYFWNHLFFVLKKGVYSVFIYFHLNLLTEVMIQRIPVWWFWSPSIFFDVTPQYGFFKEILNKIAGMGHYTIFNENPIFLWIDLINDRK